ncbi:hypothetical protein [Streptomyces sp. NRRL S-646]|uniref:hypothetical protein n=1 Tax=Streptomyces sp. NRRL S-646 TaxID=1463917 RepID=UPI0004C64B15|nr:hypothetical protein [Streptomyces sp. NRRL S-646]
MTALTTGAARAVIRVHRTTLIVWAVFIVGAVACLVWLNEVTAPSARRTIAACSRIGHCDTPFTALGFTELMGWVVTLAYYTFWAVAAWAATSLIGRELEHGTAQLAWTQGVSPARWLATKLALPALAIVLGGTLFSLVYGWARSANHALLGDDWTFPEVFADRGPTLAAWSLAALAVGTLSALVLRRSLPALGVAVTVMIVLNRCLEQYRVDLWPTVTRTFARPLPMGNGVWQVEQAGKGTWGVETGVLVHGQRNPNIDAYGLCDGTAAEARRCLDRLGIDGYYTVYHPQSHYWPMNLVETGILLTIAALATAAAFLVLRRRTARTV